MAKANWQKTDNIIAKGNWQKTDFIIAKGNWQKTDNIMANGNWQKEKTVIYKTLHKRLQIEQHELYKEQGMNSGAPGVRG